MSSLLFKNAQRSKSSSTRRYRISTSPYVANRGTASGSSLLLAPLKSMSSRTLDKHTQMFKNEYYTSVDSASRLQVQLRVLTI